MFGRCLREGGWGGGFLTARLPLLRHSAGSTGALPHQIPPVTSEDEEDEEDGGVRWSQRKAVSRDQKLRSEVLHF